MGVNYNTTLSTFRGRNTCKALRGPWRKGKIATNSIFRIDVDNIVRALWTVPVTAMSVIPQIPGVSHPIHYIS